MTQPVLPNALAPAAHHNNETDATTVDSIFQSQLPIALAWRGSSVFERIQRLRALRTALFAHRPAIYTAFALDMRKSPTEVESTELLVVIDELRHAIGNLKRWMKPRKVWPTSVTLGTRASVQMQSRGRVLIVAPWNYPLNLCLGPLVSALAAGNTAILKPSEMTPHVSAVIVQIIASVFSTNEVAVVEGGLDTSTALLALPFDHIFFTGSPAVGKAVMVAAAKNLTSVTLELGGKSPAIVDETANLELAAENLMWGKFVNNGQTCVAPDYVLVHSAVSVAFQQACASAVARMYGRDAQAMKNSPDLTRIVNTRHAHRVAGLLTDAIERGAQVFTGGDMEPDARYVAPTLLSNVAQDSRVLQEEIFGPILPFISYTDLTHAIAQINAQPKPLALYIYSRSKEHIDQVLTSTSSGGVCVNHCLVHYAHGNLPFGGVNNSGMGSAHGHYGFKAFSHERAVLRGTWLRGEKLFYPPITSTKAKFVRKLVDMLRLPML